ncbi:MAG: hypothetical protein AAF614_40615 [Chloroflexota bacterium]
MSQSHFGGINGRFLLRPHLSQSLMNERKSGLLETAVFPFVTPYSPFA